MVSDLCAWCGNRLVRIHAAKRKYCCDTCKALASNARAKADGRLEKWRAATAERKRRVPEAVRCRVCEELFESRRKGRMYCSRVCRSKAYHAAARNRPERKAQKALSDSRRRAQKRGASMERFAPLEIFERDGWVCQLCDVPIDRTVTVPSYLAATIDHMVPLSKGGGHTWANVQAAHFICNSRKSDRVALEVASSARTTAEASVDTSAA